MSLFKWSRTAASNATADSTCPFPEGMAPSALNDGTRAMMAAVAKYRDDIAGAIVTGGTSIAYTVASYEVYDTLANLNGQMIAFTPHTTNAATVTLNVDGLGAKPLRSGPSTELLAGVLIQGTPYVAVYNNSDAAWYLQGFYGNPYNIPLGGMLPYTCATAPNSSFVFPYGQAISRSTYSVYFGLVGTAYGPGDGSTTFQVMDLRGRVPAGVDSMGGAAASRLTSSYFGTAASLGAVGGSESQTLTTAQLPVHSHANTLSDPGHQHVPLNGHSAFVTFQAGVGANQLSPGTGEQATDTATAGATTGVTISNANAGSGNAHPIVPPTICCNYILRII